MSDQKDVGQNDRNIEPFVSFWSGYIQHADAQTRKLLGSSCVLDDLLALDREQLEAISEAMDVYLRSPQFLGAMRQNIDAIGAAKNLSLKNPPPTGEKKGRVRGHAADIENEQSSEMWDRFVRGPTGSQTNKDVQPCATPYDVVHEDGSVRLLRFRRDHPANVREPVLICYSLVNRSYILDLQVDRSVIRQLLRRGLDVYLIDWGIPTEADFALRLYDYVCDCMKSIADFVCEYAHTRQISLLGYCMGGTMSAMFTTLHQQQVRNLILLAAPIDFSGEQSLLNLWTREEYFDVDGLIDAFGNCPGSLLQMCFQQTKPIQNFVEKYMNLRDRRGDDAFLENFFAIERWANDNIPVAGETFREFVKLLYQQNLLIKGQMSLDERPIDLRMITCPILLLTADFDHLVPPHSTLALRNHVSSIEVEEFSINAGHIGLAVSSKAHRRLWPQAARWIAERSTPYN